MDDNPPVEITKDDIIDALMTDYSQAFLEQKVDARSAAKVVKQLIKARKLKHIKISGLGMSNNDKKLPRGYKVITSTFDEALLEYSGPDLAMRAKGVELFDQLTKVAQASGGTGVQINIISHVPEPLPLPEHFRKLRDAQAIDIEADDE